MILSALLTIFIIIVDFFIGLLPNISTMPAGFNNAWSWISGFIANLVWVIPSGTTLLTIFSLAISIHVGVFLWKNVNWIINKLRGSGN